MHRLSERQKTGKSNFRGRASEPRTIWTRGGVFATLRTSKFLRFAAAQRSCRHYFPGSRPHRLSSCHECEVLRIPCVNGDLPGRGGRRRRTRGGQRNARETVEPIRRGDQGFFSQSFQTPPAFVAVPLARRYVREGEPRRGKNGYRFQGHESQLDIGAAAGPHAPQSTADID